MFVDLRSVPDEASIESDLCIVGAGAAGIAIARELLGHQVRVTLLESGGLEYEDTVQDLCAGESTGTHSVDLVESRLRYFGGSTNHWGGNCAPFDAIDFESRSWIPHSGWPITAATMAPYFRRALSYCEVEPPGADPADVEALPEWLARLRLRLDGGELQEKVFLHSPPTRFGEVYRAALERPGSNCTVYAHANAVELETNPDGTMVTAVRTRGLDGRSHRFVARRFVLAAGIENARLLLLSNGARPQGLGNEHDMVGRCFMAHAGLHAGRIMLRAPQETLHLYGLGAWRDKATGQDVPAALGFQPRREFLERHQIANCTVFLAEAIEGSSTPGFRALRRIGRKLKNGQRPRDLAADIATVLGDVDAIAYATYLRLTEHTEHRIADLFYIIEQVPDRHSRVMLAADSDRLGCRKLRVEWRLGEMEKRTLAAVQDLLAREAGRLGLGAVQVRDLDMDKPFPAASSLSHFMGTTRMSADPRRGVVDADCRVHGVGNLYVAGGSVFPTAGANMPTANIVALALRLADHLRGRHV
ncbi:GMC oxidoreductase [Arenibaculum pallidiluteum]|uniref:GMC oxidoreductase n=1 Tax=Arenibaculum pallidiluteum TaxID=2812559 RepID=UPI001A95ADAD|nr:GMC family oxidoreductase [Arenibaculum pallidiluteum]